MTVRTMLYLAPIGAIMIGGYWLGEWAEFW